MTAFIRQIQPVWFQLQQLERPLPPFALRNALLALGAGLLLMAGLMAGSTFWAPTRLWWDATGASSAMTAGVQASLLAALATAVGALPVFLVQRVSKRQESALMAFSAGVMLSAAIFALLLPSLEAGRAMLANTGAVQTGSAGLTALGLLLGMGLMLAIDKAMPHEHPVLPPAAQGHATQWAAAGDLGQTQRAWMMVLAILIHNVPEGLAVGAAYSGTALGAGADGAAQAAGASVALAIGLQNMPEGLIVAMALRSLGKGAALSWGVAALSGLAEPLGAILGLWALGSMPAFYPVGLAVAAGAMIFVVSHEIIPETHRNGFEGLASAMLMAGFVFMLMLDAALK
ncbi:ZIP family metal transporter [Hydrogenophaga sp. PAMC20947]|uniref:ZIP family metal transporter n=1 Tax=Hydrogenophaga sp. PAMC20947 TaxID=2565558 RepID=UPI00109E0CB1|nr:ZIP family metal transporter [Hydrogenophaga sp. PAMC20947]QCB46300.1 ZIP family metal transporter [Hydrogenophaga sp. PAMC20947]